LGFIQKFHGGEIVSEGIVDREEDAVDSEGRDGAVESRMIPYPAVEPPKTSRTVDWERV
jgi:hypothetical protein